MCITDSIKNEFFDAPLADNRLVNRLTTIADSFYTNPGSHIPEACGSYAATVGAYRFFSNNRVKPEAILMGHREQTIERMRNHKVVLAIQDTTVIDYKDHPKTKDLGTCSTSKDALGLLNHSTLAVSEEGVPLGILSREVWTRDPKEFGKSSKRKNQPTEDKESQKWLTALDSSLVGVPKYIDVVTVCDREADTYDFFHKAVTDGKDLLVRVAQKKRTLGDGKTLIKEIENQPVMGQIITRIPRDAENKRPERDITLSIKYCPVTIKPPYYRRRPNSLPQLPDLDLYIVVAEEAIPPEGESPIFWLLLTTLPIENMDQAAEKIRWYKQRWKIERYHHVFKNGCKIEELQLEEVDHLQNALAVYSIVAWKLMWIKYASEDNPDASCDIVLQKCEWQALYCVANKTHTPPELPPSLGDAVLMIAKMGGFLARKCDGKPGVEVIWRGLRRLYDISLGWQWQIEHLPISSQ
jgi:Transposase DNA-binding/Transposase Tn5 dimerisation domain